jgi:hypothetical protein
VESLYSGQARVARDSHIGEILIRAPRLRDGESLGNRLTLVPVNQDRVSLCAGRYATSIGHVMELARGEERLCSSVNDQPTREA